MYGPPHLQRRRFLQLGVVSALVLAVAGGAVALMQPGLEQGRLSKPSRQIFERLGAALLAGLLPAEPGAQAQALQALLTRIDHFLAERPPHVQAEISQLLGLMATAAGRRGLVGLSASWEDASVAELSAALASMRASGMALRQQAFLGLHDLVFAPYFSGTESWPVLGYPGPRPLA